MRTEERVLALSFELFCMALALFIAQKPSMFTLIMGVLVISDPDGKDGQIYCSGDTCECAEFHEGHYCWHRAAYTIMTSKTQG